MHEELRLLENAGCISKCLGSCNNGTPKTDPLNPQKKTTAPLSLRLPVTQ